MTETDDSDAVRTETDGGRQLAGDAEPVHVTGPDHFDELVESRGVVLADFYADWCGPCKMLEPIVADLAAETDATVAKVDVDSQVELAQRFQVRGVPTMVLFSDGEAAEQLVGLRDRDTLERLVEQYAE
ncbi:MAG: thioredoxin [Salinigranum sp.]